MLEISQRALVQHQCSVCPEAFFFSCESQEITHTSAEAREKHSERGNFHFYQGRLSLQISNSVGAENVKINLKKAGFYVSLKSVLQ